MRAIWLLPLVAAPAGWAFGRWVRPAADEPVPSPPAEAAPRSTPPPAPRRCPPALLEVDDEPSPIPPDWDPERAEQRRWAEAEAAATELGGQVLALECAYWPCIGAVLVPDGLDWDDTHAKLLARWPGATIHRAPWQEDGVRFDVDSITFSGDLPDEVEREVALRRISLDLEVREAAEGWADAHRARDPIEPPE